MKIAISVGHGLHVRGARGNPVPPQLDEVNAARVLTERIAAYLDLAGVEVETFFDETSHDVGTNLDTIVDWHNDSAFDGGDHDYDISVHLNCYNGQAHGCEVLYTSDPGLEMATELSAAIAVAGNLTNRGPKERNDLAFLNGTRETACLLEVGFCDHTGDSQNLRARVEEVSRAIAET